MTFTLDAGVLVPVKNAGDLGVRQRLYNLGYGPDKLQDWDKDPGKSPSDSQEAEKHFRQDQKLGDDEDIVDPLKAAYGS
jgi:hypothetical protein